MLNLVLRPTVSVFAKRVTVPGELPGRGYDMSGPSSFQADTLLVRLLAWRVTEEDGHLSFGVEGEARWVRWPEVDVVRRREGPGSLGADR